MATNTPHPHYTENPSAFPLEGGCACGQIRYRIETAPLAVHDCHCTSCQRETGAGSAINIITAGSDVTPLPPAPAATVPARPGDPDTFPPAGPAPAAVKRGGDGEVVRPVAVCLPGESGEAQVVMRCPACLVAVWSDYGSGGVVKWVRGGTLDRAWLVGPDVHIFVRSKRDFVAICDDKPQFDAYYSRKLVWRQESLEKYETLLPEIRRYEEGLRKQGA